MNYLKRHFSEGLLIMTDTFTSQLQYKTKIAYSLTHHPKFNKDMCSFEDLSNNNQIEKFSDFFVNWISRYDTNFASQYVIPRLLFKNVSMIIDDGSNKQIDVGNMLFINAAETGYLINKDNERDIGILIEKFSSSRINIDYIKYCKGTCVNGYITMHFDDLIKYQAEDSLRLSWTFPDISIDDNISIGDFYNIFMRDINKIPFLYLTSNEISKLYHNIFRRIFNMPYQMCGGFALFGTCTNDPMYYSRCGACNCWARILAITGPDNTMALYRDIFKNIEGDRVYLSRNISKKTTTAHSKKKK